MCGSKAITAVATGGLSTLVSAAGGLLGGTQTTPTATTEVTPTAVAVDADTQAARDDEKKRRAAAAGLSSTILGGTTAGTTTGTKSLLGS